MSKSLQELDPNFRVPVVEGGLAWHVVSTLDVEGLGWPKESQPFCRLPDRAHGVVRDDVWQLSRTSAGVLAHFWSDAPRLSARWTLRNENLAMDHMPATGVSGLDLYARDGVAWRWCGVGRALQFPDNEFLLLQDVESAGEEREYLLYLPLYNGASEVKIGVPEGASLRLEKRNQKPICFYGTSIVHGGCASRPGMAYPAIIGRKLNYPTINLGFSGNARCESEVADLLAELDPQVFVLDPLPNMSTELVRERLEDFVSVVRAARPSTPIVLIENINYQYDWIRQTEMRAALDKNSALREVFETLQKSGMQHLRYIGGENLLGDDGEGTVDGVHPTDVGFLRMADEISQVIAPLLPNTEFLNEPGA